MWLEEDERKMSKHKLTGVSPLNMDAIRKPEPEGPHVRSFSLLDPAHIGFHK